MDKEQKHPLQALERESAAKSRQLLEEARKRRQQEAENEALRRELEELRARLRGEG